MEDVAEFDEGYEGDVAEEEVVDDAGGVPPNADGVAEAKTTKQDHPDANENGKVSAAVPFVCGSNLDEAIDMWGEEFVYEHFATLFKRRLQNRVRRFLKDGVPVEQVEEEFSIENYDPTDTSRRGGDDVTSLLRKLNNLDEEEKAELRESIDL